MLLRKEFTGGLICKSLCWMTKERKVAQGAFALAWNKKWFRRCRKDLKFDYILLPVVLSTLSLKYVRGTVNNCPLSAHLFVFLRHNQWETINNSVFTLPKCTTQCRRTTGLEQHSSLSLIKRSIWTLRITVIKLKSRWWQCYTFRWWIVAKTACEKAEHTLYHIPRC